jgi:hypothetical protein
MGFCWAIKAGDGNVMEMKEGLSSSEALRQEELLRRKRRQETLYRRRRIRFAAGFGLLCFVVAGIIIAIAAGGSTAQVDSQGLLVSGDPSPSAPVSVRDESRPAFARLGDRNLLLPVAARDVTIIAFQPVSSERAVLFSPIGDQANSNALVRFFRGIFAGEPSVRYYLLDGDGTAATGAALVGAAPGSPVNAPVSGTVTAVKHYSLYGKYDDVQIDIRPEEMSGITVSMLFVDEPVVSIGEVVTAGKTMLGKVRECPEELGKQLAVYTHDSGSHVFMQATEEPIS